MSWCAVYGCNRNKKEHKDHVTFFSLSTEPKVRKEWISKINRTELPKEVFVCHKHFKEEWFDPNRKLFVEMTGARIKENFYPEQFLNTFIQRCLRCTMH